MGRNKLLTKTAKKILLSYYVGKSLERIYRFYAVARIGGYDSHPWIPTPHGLLFNVETSKQNLLDIKRILDEAGIRFWLMFGTFLGAYRDHDIIPYDEDTDLAIYSEDLPRVFCCEEAFAEKGFSLGVQLDAVTLYRDGEHTDIYCFHPNGNKRVWVSMRYDISAFQIYNEIQFLGENFRILGEPERWLRYTYGEDWRTPIKGKSVPGYAYGEEFEST